MTTPSGKNPGRAWPELTLTADAVERMRTTSLEGVVGRQDMMSLKWPCWIESLISMAILAPVLRPG